MGFGNTIQYKSTKIVLMVVNIYVLGSFIYHFENIHNSLLGAIVVLCLLQNSLNNAAIVLLVWYKSRK